MLSHQPAPTAFPTVWQCQSDPVIVLSDGTIVDVSVEINTWLTNVREVSYVVHIPAGTQPVLVISTPNWPHTVEHFAIYADKAPGEFSSITTVQTTHGNTPVIAKLKINAESGAANGHSEEAVQVSLIN